MTQITIDLNLETAEQIKRLADGHGVPLEEEARNILTQAAKKNDHPIPPKEKLDLDEWRRRLDEFRESIGPIKSDSAQDIRELRDSR